MLIEAGTLDHAAEPSSWRAPTPSSARWFAAKILASGPDERQSREQQNATKTPRHGIRDPDTGSEPRNRRRAHPAPQLNHTLQISRRQPAIHPKTLRPVLLSKYHFARTVSTNRRASLGATPRTTRTPSSRRRACTPATSSSLVATTIATTGCHSADPPRGTRGAHLRRFSYGRCCRRLICVARYRPRVVGSASCRERGCASHERLVLRSERGWPWPST